MAVWLEELMAIHFVSIEELFSTKTRHVVDARRAIWKDLIGRGWSSGDVAKLFDTDSSTVTRAVKK